MEKVLTIGNKQIKFKSTAGTMMRYRNFFRRDFIKDLVHLQEKFKKRKENGSDFELLDLEIFEKIAWCMAKTADSELPDIEHWLDEFDSFDIMLILPEILTLLIDNTATLNNTKKKINQPKKAK